MYTNKFLKLILMNIFIFPSNSFITNKGSNLYVTKYYSKFQDKSSIEIKNNKIKFVDDWITKMDIKPDSENNNSKLDPITKIKDAGKAGVISYAITELSFWIISIPTSIFLFTISTGTLPDLSTQEGITIIGGYSFALLTFARTIVPLRIALALAITPWIKNNIIEKFNK